MIRRGGVTYIAWVFARLEIKCLISNQHFTHCKYGLVISQLRVLASHKTNFESVAQGALELYMFLFGRCYIFSDLACFDISSKKRFLYRYFTYHLKVHTISNKMVPKVSAQKKGEESYDSYKYVFKFR